MPSREPSESRLQLVATGHDVADLTERRRASRARHPSAVLVEVVDDDDPPPAA